MTAITYTSIANKESGLSARNKINLLGASVASMSNEVIDEIDTITDNITALDTRIDNLEVVKSLIAVGTSTTLTAQTISSTPSKLVFISNEQLKCGTKFTSNVLDNSITVSSNVTCTVGGTITVQDGVGNIVTIEMYVNGLPTGNLYSIETQGASKPVSLSYYGVASFNTADVITLYVYSTGTSIQVTKSSLVIEEKGC